MRYLAFIVTLSLFFSCNDDCEDARMEYNRASKEHAQKQEEAAKLADQLEGFDLEDEEQIEAHQIVEDELTMVLVEIAVLEIAMEDFKNKKFQCF